MIPDSAYVVVIGCLALAWGATANRLGVARREADRVPRLARERDDLYAAVAWSLCTRLHSPADEERLRAVLLGTGWSCPSLEALFRKGRGSLSIRRDSLPPFRLILEEDPGQGAA